MFISTFFTKISSKETLNLFFLLSRKCSGRNSKVLEGDRQTPEDNKVNKVENNLMQLKLLPKALGKPIQSVKNPIQQVHNYSRTIRQLF